MATSIEKRHYVYVIFRPDGSPCYVGKGRGKRWQSHFWDFKSRKINPHLASIITQGKGRLPVILLRTELTNAEACEIEIALIRAIGREKHGGPLVNLTDGGDGTVGLNTPKSKEHCAKIAIGNTGKKFSDERRANISKSLIGRKASAEECLARSIRQTGVKRGPYKEGTGANISRSKIGKKLGPKSEAAKAKISAAHRGRKRPPFSLEWRAAIGKGLRAYYENGGKRTEQQVVEARQRALAQHAAMTEDEKRLRGRRIRAAKLAAAKRNQFQMEFV
jgi:hypothetical protein